MSKATAEVQILDRVMHLLEENSVQQLMKTDERFAEYIEQLYATVDAKSVSLQSL